MSRLLAITLLCLTLGTIAPATLTSGTIAASANALPAPTGPYPVGRVAYHWIDETRGEIYAQQAGEKRELLVWIWYPAAPPRDAEPAPYSPPGWEATGEFWGFDAAGVESHAVADAPVADDQASYPVLLFTANGAPPLSFAATIEEVVSHGYVVVGVNNTYQTPVTIFPDGRAIPASPDFLTAFFGPFSDPVAEVVRRREAIVDYKVADLLSVVRELERLNSGSEPLAGRLDLTRLGAFGHSMGGNAALEFCRIDRRCKAAVNLDGANWTEVGRTGLSVPAMLIAAGYDGGQEPCTDFEGYPAELCEADRALTMAGFAAVHATAQPSYWLTVRGAAHVSFMDIPFLTVLPDGPIQSNVAAATIDPARMWRITCDYLLAFFAKHLNGEDSPLLDGPSPAYPEVTFEVGGLSQSSFHDWTDAVAR